MKSVTEKYLDKELEHESECIVLPEDYQLWLDTLESTDEQKDRMAEIYENSNNPVF